MPWLGVMRSDGSVATIEGQEGKENLSMSLVKTGRTVLVIAEFALIATLPVMSGCAKNDSNAAASDPALIASGKAVFDANGCARCHSGGGRAPDLSRVGADPSHTPQWLAEHVKNPKSQNPASR